MPDVSLNGIEFAIKGSSDEASASIDSLVSNLNRLSDALGAVSSKAKFEGIGKRAKEALEPLSETVQETVRNADKIDVLRAKLISLSMALDDAFASGNLGKAWSIQGQILSTKAALEKATEAANGTKRGIEDIGNAAKKASPSLGGFVASIKRIALYRLIRSIIKSVTEAVREGTKNFYEYSKAVGAPFAAAMDNMKSAALTMKNQIGSAFGELYQIVVPIILDLISYVTQLAEVLSKLFAALRGAEGWYKATNGAGQTAEAIGGVGRAAKEALKYLAPFDELNRLPSQSTGGGGGGSASAVDYNDMFEFQAFDEESTLGKIAKIVRENLEAVQLLIDEFGFAIGVALLASGHIGLGLGMMLYFGYKGIKDASTNWDTIKTQLQGSLGKVTTIVSLSLLALGAILAFSGASLPIGIGMMVAGAAGLAIETAANWDAITESLRGPLGTATAVIGAATLVLGIFALLGGNIPLGIGLLLAGAVGLGTTIAANWDNIKEIGRQFVDNIKSGIDEGIANIKTWVKEHISDPFKEAFSGNSGDGVNTMGFGVSLPFSVSLENFTLPDLSVLKDAWKNIKTKKATLTAKKSGTKDSVFTKIADAWAKIFTKDASLSADLISNVDFDLLEKIKDAWGSLKKKTANLTANLKGTSSKTFTKVKDAWDKIYTKTSNLTANLVQNFSDSAMQKLKDWWSALGNVKATFTAALSASDAVKNFVSAWNKLKDVSLNLTVGLKNTVKDAWNKAANAWNGSWLASSFGTLPTLARGGVVDQATFIGNAIVGEAGKEAIVPLERNTEWVGMVASGMVKELSKTNSGGIDYASMGEAMYAAMSRALSENQDDRDIILDGNVVYNSVLTRNRREIFRSGRNPMMSAT